MSIQRQIKLVGITPTCLCGRQPKGYSTDFVEFHLECNHCAIFTVRLSNLTAAKREFGRLLKVIEEDRVSKQKIQGVVK